jgi:uncharacterized membrane protein SirB2
MEDTTERPWLGEKITIIIIIIIIIIIMYFYKMG